jgi:putative ABC transport system permease protein
MEDPQHPAGILINASRDKINGVYTAGESLAVKPDDTLRYQIPAEITGGSPFTSAFTVGAVTDRLPMGIERTPFSQQQLVVCDSVFDTFQERLPANLRMEDTVLFLNTNDDTKLEAQINEMAGKPTVYNVAAMARQEHDINLVFEIFIFGFIVLISLICIANMFNTITTNVALRRREFAMLRSVGMTPKGFGRMIRYESVFYGLKALLWGLPISFGIGLLLNRLASSSLGGVFIFPWPYYLTAGVLLFVIVMTTMLYASARAKRENIVDALTGEDL